MPDQLDRKSTRLREFDYSSGHTYFVTICTRDRKHLFGSIVEGRMILNPYGSAVQGAWDETVEMRRELVHHGFVVMPNHVHALFSLDPMALVGSGGDDLGVDPDALQSVTTSAAGVVARARRPHSVSTIVGGFKGDATRRIRALTRISPLGLAGAVS